MLLYLVLFGLVFFVTVAAAAADVQAVPVIVENRSPGSASQLPVSAGVPFARKTLADCSALSLSGPDGKAVPLQTQVLAGWPDGSCRWVLCDFAADAPAGATAAYTLSAGGKSATLQDPVRTDEKKDAVTLSNGLITYRVAVGGSHGTIASAGGKSSADIVSLVEIGAKGARTTSKVVVDRLEVYARGPVRAAVAIYGRRLYSDGIEGPFSERVEMFAGWPYVRVEDTLVYAHFPGTHAKPENPLALWAIEARASGDKGALDVVSLVAPEEAEGTVVSPNRVAFWGKDEPLDMSRWTDEELIGEDTPGISLGVGKSCAVLVGFPTAAKERAAARQMGFVRAHTTPEVYAASGALGRFAPQVAGKFEEVEEGMRQILGFFMWFQDHDPKGLWGRGPWHGLFDWGDWQVRYTDVDNRPTGWQYLEGRYGWDCNEMDTTLMLWSAFCHTAGPEYWRAAVAMSRHTMDVDMINVDYRKYKLPDYVYDPHSYGAPWKEGQDRLKVINTIGLGRRHNVQHWGNGVGDTRHTWNGGVMMYYYLTGNRRAYDAVLTMADMHMQRIWGYACGEYTLSLWCLYNAWQLTGERKFLDEFKYRLGVIHKLRLPDGGIPEHLDFDKAKAYPEVDGNVSGGASLAFDYISNALADYYADTQDPVARETLLGLCKMNLKEPIRPGDAYNSVNYLRAFSWAYQETGDKRFLERVRFFVGTLSAKPLVGTPSTEKEWFEGTYEVMETQAWQIRHVGPGVRMLPYALQALADAQNDRK